LSKIIPSFVLRRAQIFFGGLTRDQKYSEEEIIVPVASILTGEKVFLVVNLLPFLSLFNSKGK
jgi:hypothetical protein